MFGNYIQIPIGLTLPKHNKVCMWAQELLWVSACSSAFTEMCRAPTTWQHPETAVGEEFYTKGLTKGTICQPRAWQAELISLLDVPTHPRLVQNTLVLISLFFFSKRIACSPTEADAGWCEDVVEPNLGMWFLLVNGLEMTEPQRRDRDGDAEKNNIWMRHRSRRGLQERAGERSLKRFAYSLRCPRGGCTARAGCAQHGSAWMSAEKEGWWWLMGRG